jgi:VWFA-related protein
MRILPILALTVGLAAAASGQAPAGPQQNPPAAAPATAGALPPPPQGLPAVAAASAPQGTPPSSGPLKTNTRLIAVDVVVTDSHGNAIRGLKAGDFQISEEHSGPQKISQFQFIDASRQPPPAYPLGLVAASPGAPYLYTNLLPDKMRVPPTVMLMDALNTQIENQSGVHRHMLMLLKTLPPTTPVAVFTLGHQLHVLQGFTTDPRLLRTAVDHTLRSPDIADHPQDDANSPSNVFLDQNNDTETAANQVLEDFEKVDYEQQMAVRVDETTDAMIAIAKFLGGYPGRKNLLWFSESFPNWIAPTADFGSDSFMGTADYSDRIRQASEALADARIAVYPVDARGLEANTLYSSASTPHINRNNPGASLAGTMNRENSTRIDTQATMDMIAGASGGKVCTNNNDLSGCVQAALDDSSVYYELGYYPENVKWDGRFHKISVKTTAKGARLRYRTGYVATEPGLTAPQPPGKLLQQACMDPLPSTSISMTAETLAPPRGTADPSARYLLTISPSALSLPPAGVHRQLNLQMAVCEFDPKDASFQFYPRDLSGPVSEAVFQSWQTLGIRDIFDYQAKPEDYRLRFAVLDVPSGAIGSVDVPAHPKQFGIIPSVPSTAGASAAGGASGSAPPTHVGFKGSNGASSMLDWTGDAVAYHGDLGIDLGARGLFESLFTGKYHCEAGSLVPNDISATAKPNLVLTLRKTDGHKAVIDLGGEAPAYSGDLAVDPSARSYFDYLWKLCHCQQP